MKETIKSKNAQLSEDDYMKGKLQEAHSLSLSIEGKLRSLGTLITGYSEGSSSNTDPEDLFGIGEILSELSDQMKTVTTVLDKAGHH